MEIPGCALMSIFGFFLFKSISQKKINPFLLGICYLYLYFYKSLFIGIFFGLISVLIFAHSNDLITFKTKDEKQFYFFLTKLIGTISCVYFIFTKFIFLPLAPWMNVLPKQENIDGLYADFAGGFFNDIIGNLQGNLYIFLGKVVFHYYPFLVSFFLPKGESFYPIIPYWFEVGIYFIAFFYVIVISIFLWKTFLPIQRCFVLFTTISAITFNMIYISIAGCTGLGLLYRYNLGYLPLLVISSGIIFYSIFIFFNSLFLKYKIRVYFLLLSFIVLVYIPAFHSFKLIINRDENWFYDSVYKNTEIIKKYTQGSSPMFVYSTGGSYITLDMFPTREIFMETTNEKIKRINTILPKPIEYLFLKPENVLFKENWDLISKGQPIIDGSYVFSGIDAVNKTIVYKLNPNYL